MKIPRARAPQDWLNRGYACVKLAATLKGRQYADPDGPLLSSSFAGVSSGCADVMRNDRPVRTVRDQERHPQPPLETRAPDETASVASAPPRTAGKRFCGRCCGRATTVEAGVALCVAF